MAQPTSPHAGPPASQAQTPGVSPQAPSTPAAGQMGKPPAAATQQTPETEGAKPVLFEDIDPVLLARLYPQAFTEGVSEARSLAMQAGNEVHEQGVHLQANVNDEQPQPATGTSAAPTTQPSSTRPQTAPARPDEPALHGQPTAAGAAYPVQQHAQQGQPQQPQPKQPQQPAPSREAASQQRPRPPG